MSIIQALTDYFFLSEQLIKMEFYSFWGIQQEEYMESATTKSRENEEKKQFVKLQTK